jgi:saccharopine dehydrogenase-like NADP-dependent oxidoreductase
MKHILLFGAGKSATVLIDYLKNLSEEKHWQVTVADNDAATVQSKVGHHPYTKAVQLNIEEEAPRKQLIQQADIVISMMPPTMHYLIALDCIEFNKHLLTASYVDEKIKMQASLIKAKGILFLCEMGLDPGIDHMSALHLIHQIQQQNGIITSFKSHCGGLISPESDDNPWHYKISWNPRNVVLAGKAGAIFKENGINKKIPYEQLFNPNQLLESHDKELYASYPNRDSLQYMQLYGLENADTFIRTTLRHPEFCFGWKNIVDLKLTNEEKVYETAGLTIADFFQLHFQKHGFTEWLNNLLRSKLNDAKSMVEKIIEMMEAEQQLKEEGENIDEEIMIVDEHGKLNSLNVEDVKDKAAESMALKMHEANLSMKQLFFLGLDDDRTHINKGLCSAADVLQFILEKKWALQKDDKDLIVMLHEIEYVLNGQHKKVESELKIKGDDYIRTAMAKTVGLPLGIAAKLILEGKIKEIGLHIPIIASIYEPVLNELKKFGIEFKEFYS